MKIQSFTLLFLMNLLFSSYEFLLAQSPVTGIVYSYDASGNRTKREPSFGIVERKAAPAEEQKTETAVIANNMVASFTPNPTVTGNFTVVVSKKYFAANEKNAPTEKPALVSVAEPQISCGELCRIIIYNPLGELIHQETTPYDNAVNINLARHARGIYLVKLVLSGAEGVQSGNEMLMQRMVYE